MAESGHESTMAVRTVEAMLDASPDAFLALAEDGTITLANGAATKLFGLDRRFLTGRDYRTLLADRSHPEVDRLFRQILDRSAAHPREVAWVHADGTSFSAEVAGSLFPAGAGQLPGDPAAGAGGTTGTAPDDGVPGGAQVLLSVRATSHRQATNADLRHAMSLLTSTLESTADGILVMGSNGTVAGYNDQFLTMWNIPRKLMEGDSADPVMQRITSQLTDPGTFLARLMEVQSNTTAESHDVVDFKDGRTFERYSRPHKVGEDIVGRVWSFRDVTPRRRAQEQAHQAMLDLAEQAEKLRVMAFQDPLTGLANRAVFNDALAGSLQEPRLKAVDVLLLDLDDFKEVNDLLGHQAGDDMLIEVARRLRGCVPTADVVARLGGDEFVVLLTACPNVDEIAACIVRCLHVPVTISGRALRPSLSLGVASRGREEVGPSELLRQADIAMYAAKAAGKNRFLRFHPDMMAALVQRTDMESGLQFALQGGEITVDFQPIVSHRSGQVVQFEALARWDRGAGRVPPSDFIPLAERTGLIRDIGLEVMSQAMAQLADWLGEDPQRSLAVNVSGVQLQEHDFAAKVLGLAETRGVAARQLVLEVTESVFFHADCDLIRQLSTLRDAGARVALDDFGTGYSSLGRLQDLPVDTVKIDKTFVSMVRTGSERLPILSSMINMAHSLGLTVTAEGIETASQADYLTALDCDALQGYLFSLPEPAARLEKALRRAEEVLGALQQR
ncbi:diguanylate cyclase/phosphodiesterase with PAS/PAC sensor(s) [Pseudarthrobacter chlorophenolicus A6]|uniref:Diguanylate cyclase/phosphodiesterase with PAS/PAC sensor(S) n=1 Tax=Pseudarthrobacter chlorophenolicus (strain ATCC 700700 / DSM 12829 / CIP 107037 / JCM 12360 / KCTC 9906 / NCIMB 13794 / A6) TaxID=452863 RepID=B8HEA5_PSECP|nr:EAL domain-containing protein [Pseudarthrobacter chlorophenolicus]ACL39140.1 diguanylate cyclase/phosphodiesterase with PAS/PAC sensor(s) [Pseudarthrobacter chlorophenolicus A6]SDR03733.1 PAS domain S-box-containing protein/diguanylate cyclase (GGDEF) domain-containing protein [Pseudarthrobacter chlorophenolicus]